MTPELKKRIEGEEGVVGKEQALREAVEGWWKKHKKVLVELPDVDDSARPSAASVASRRLAASLTGTRSAAPRLFTDQSAVSGT